MVSKMTQQKNKVLCKTNKWLKCGKAHASSPSSFSPLQVLKCLSFSLIRWPQQGTPHQPPQEGEPGLGLWRVYDYVWHIDSKWICIELRMRGVVGISFATTALSWSEMHFLPELLKETGVCTRFRAILRINVFSTSIFAVWIEM